MFHAKHTVHSFCQSFNGFRWPGYGHLAGELSSFTTLTPHISGAQSSHYLSLLQRYVRQEGQEPVEVYGPAGRWPDRRRVLPLPGKPADRPFPVTGWQAVSGQRAGAGLSARSQTSVGTCWG